MTKTLNHDLLKRFLVIFLVDKISHIYNIHDNNKDTFITILSLLNKYNFSIWILNNDK